MSLLYQDGSRIQKGFPEIEISKEGEDSFSASSLSSSDDEKGEEVKNESLLLVDRPQKVRKSEIAGKRRQSRMEII